MPLKRGRDRESCSFCYRRKIKCDRQTRESEGHTQCTACATRATECVVDEEVYRRKSVKLTRDADATSPTQRHTPNPGTKAAASSHSPVSQRTTQSSTIPQSIPGSTLPLNNRSPGNVLPTSALTPGPTPLSTHNIVDPIDQAFTTSQKTPYQLAHDALGPNLFYLSEQGTSFLDYIFLGDFDNQDWTTFGADLTQMNMAQIDTQAPSLPASTPIDASSSAYHNLERPVGIDQQTFEAALHAYFEVPSVALPVLSARAFWKEYSAGTCNASLLFAIACRGLPFINIDNKWAVQQQMANEFRKSFLREQSIAEPTILSRLGSIEALALMVDFSYQHELEDVAQRHLCRMYMTHDSMVVMTLQAGLDMSKLDSHRARHSAAKTRERFTLLFWHVYALDAFRCLDQQHISRVREDGGDDFQSLPQSEEKGYLDDILEAARIARLISSEIDRTISRKKFRNYDNLTRLYTRLEAWRMNRKQLARQRHTSADSRSSDTSSTTETQARKRADEIAEIQSFILQAIELECYLQMEIRIARMLIKLGPGLESESLKLRTELEAINAMQRFLAHPAWSPQSELAEQSNSYLSYFDQIPFILRDVCEGICLWLLRREISQRAIHNSESNMASMLPSNDGASRSEHRATPSTYLAIIKRLRDAIMSARSHHDTVSMVQGLDVRIAATYGTGTPVT